MFYKKTNWMKIISVNNKIKKYEEVLQDRNLKAVVFLGEEFGRSVDGLLGNNFFGIGDGLSTDADLNLMDSKEEVLSEKELLVTIRGEYFVGDSAERGQRIQHSKKVFLDLRGMHLAKQKSQDHGISLGYLLLLTDNEKIRQNILQIIGLFVTKLPVDIWLMNPKSRSKNIVFTKNRNTMDLAGSSTSIKNFAIEISNAVKNIILTLFNEICLSSGDNFSNILENSSLFICEKEIISLEPYLPSLFLDKIILPGLINFQKLTANVQISLTVFTHKFLSSCTSQSQISDDRLKLLLL